MALIATVPEICSHVIGAPGLWKQSLVARAAAGIDKPEIPVNMTLLARDGLVCSGQNKAALLMLPHHFSPQPCLGDMTLRARFAELILMNIGMTGDAVCFPKREFLFLMARCTFNRLMTLGQHKAGQAVIEEAVRPQCRRGRDMTCPTGEPCRAVWRELGK